MRLVAVIVWTALAGAAVIAMFRISFEVERLEARLHELNREIAREQEAIHVLQAEWSYLNRPQRIEDLSHDFLPGLLPVAPNQFVTFARLPMRGEAEEAPGVPVVGPTAFVPAMRPFAGGQPQ